MLKQPLNKYDYQQLSNELKNGRPGNCYIFYGDERFLLERTLEQLRGLICPDGQGSFNYRQFDGKTVNVDEIEAAVNTYPVFAERTLIEVIDYNMFGSKAAAGESAKSQSDESEGLQLAEPDDNESFQDEAAPAPTGKKASSTDADQRLVDLISDLPSYVCLVFVFDLVAFKPDSRRKKASAILKQANTVEFTVQNNSRLTKWIIKHFETSGKTIGSADAAYLSFITGGLMYSLLSEINKVSAYAKGQTVTRADIDAVVTPVLDAVAYKLTDALIKREFKTSMQILDELFRMREPPHKIMFAIAAKMRQLLAARICIDNNLDKKALIDIIGLPKNLEFQAGYLLDTARKTTLVRCREYVLQCSETGYALNSQPDPELRIIELLAKLAFASD